MGNQSDFLCSIAEIGYNESIGEKTRGIKFLFENNFLIPNTYVCSSKAYEEHLNSGLLKFQEEEKHMHLTWSHSFTPMLLMYTKNKGLWL